MILTFFFYLEIRQDRDRMTHCLKMSISNHLSSCEIDYPHFLKFCLSWKRDFNFKLVYLQEFLSDLSG